MNVQLALTLVTKGEGHLKHRACLVFHYNRVFGKAEYHRLAKIPGLQENRKVAVAIRHRKLIRRIVGAQSVAGFDVLLNL